MTIARLAGNACDEYERVRRKTSTTQDTVPIADAHPHGISGLPGIITTSLGLLPRLWPARSTGVTEESMSTTDMTYGVALKNKVAAVRRADSRSYGVGHMTVRVEKCNRR